MWKTKLCLGIYGDLDMDIKEQISIFKKIGFDGFFINWNSDMNVLEIRQHADIEGMAFQSIHAPFRKSADMWTEGAKAEEGVQELMACLDDCAKAQVPIMVCHCYIGFDDSQPNEFGVKNFGRVIEYAKKLGVKIAFENCEQERFLECLMEVFKDCEHVGFCWDTGHEMCYNHSKDMMALYGERLICTHINDNLGIRDFHGKITCLDDLHLLPFDRIADWDGIVRRMNKYGYNDILTFELNIRSKPNRHENDSYQHMEPNLYLTEVYKRACRIAALKERARHE